jgi:hypothetical protein
MKSKYRITVPGFYSVQNYARIRRAGEGVSEPNVWKIRTENGEQVVYREERKGKK